MNESLSTVRRLLNIPDSTELEERALLTDVGVSQQQVIDALQARFPLLLGVNNSDQQAKQQLFEAGMAHVVSPEQQAADQELGRSFGEPWTAARLAAVFARCAESEYPDNGSD